MDLISDISADLVNESASLPNTLRKAKLLASDIGSPEFREWVDHELEGYPGSASLPNYRRLKATNLGDFSGPFGSMAENVVLPISDLPTEVKDFVEELVFTNGVSELQAMLGQGSEPLRRPWPQEAIWLARDRIKMSGDMVLRDAYQAIPPYIISGILDNVKSRLLDFMIGLKESDIAPESLSKAEKETVQNLFHIYVTGDHNIVTSGDHIQQEIKNIHKGDSSALLEYLRSIEIEEADLEEINEAISQEKNIDHAGEFGPKVSAWIGKMVLKASSNVWKVGVVAAPQLLARAINEYYGFGGD